MQPCACAHLVRDLSCSMHVHLVVALPVCSEASGSRALTVYPPTYTPVATTQVDHILPHTHIHKWGVLHKGFSTSSLSLCQCTKLKQG